MTPGSAAASISRSSHVTDRAIAIVAREIAAVIFSAP